MSERAEECCCVCGAARPRVFTELDSGTYWRCDSCRATWLDPADRLSAQDERRHYTLHENTDDTGYRQFLARLANPLLDRLEPGLSGLDYGCGPGPVLAQMLEEAGHAMAVYDPFFADTPDVLDRTHDFITCTEVVEHFHDPRGEFEHLDGMLNPGGWLAIMTCFQTDDGKFADWHYRRDPTHVVFYREETLRHVAGQRGWTCEIPAKDIALMHKPEPQVEP